MVGKLCLVSQNGTLQTKKHSTKIGAKFLEVLPAYIGGKGGVISLLTNASIDLYTNMFCSAVFQPFSSSSSSLFACVAMRQLCHGTYVPSCFLFPSFPTSLSCFLCPLAIVVDVREKGEKEERKQSYPRKERMLCILMTKVSSSQLYYLEEGTSCTENKPLNSMAAGTKDHLVLFQRDREEGRNHLVNTQLRVRVCLLLNGWFKILSK